MTFGVIGLGAMGGGLAASLARAGHRVVGFDPDKTTCDRAQAAGVTALSSRAAVCEDADTLVVCLASLSAIRDTYSAVLAMQPAPTCVIETSTIAPERVRGWGVALRAIGTRYIDATMIGLPPDAEAGRLFFLVGGHETDIARVRPFLDATSRGFVHLGDIGSGAVAKVLNNAIGGATMLIFTEAVVTAKRAGLDPSAFVRAVVEANGAGNSVVFQRLAHWVASDEAQPPTPLNFKDMAEMAEMIAALGGQAPMMRQAITTTEGLSREPGLVQAYAKTLSPQD